MFIIEEVKRIASQCAANDRVILRRWLRKYHKVAETELPTQLYLDLSVSELCEYVQMYGGDSEEILESGRERLLRQFEKEGEYIHG